MSENKVIKISGNARFKTKSDTLANWTKHNPVLLSGEPGVVTDGTETEKIKFGDGVNHWNDLPYWKGPKGEKGDKGEYYILTEQDKTDIANQVLSQFTDVSEVGL